MPASHEDVLARIGTFYRMLLLSDGDGKIRVDIRFVKKETKEVLVGCGKQYRFLLPYQRAGQQEGDQQDNR